MRFLDIRSMVEYMFNEFWIWKFVLTFVASRRRCLLLIWRFRPLSGTWGSNCSSFIWPKQRIGSGATFLNRFWASWSLGHFALHHWSRCVTCLKWGTMHRVSSSISLASIHCFNSSASGTNWATRFETLVVAVGFEGRCLSRLLCAVRSTGYSLIGAQSCTIINTCHEAQLQGSSWNLDVPSGHGCSKAANLAKTSSCWIHRIGSWRPLHLIIFILTLIWVLSRYLTRMCLAAGAFAVKVCVPSSTSTIISSHRVLAIDNWTLSSRAFWRLSSRHNWHGLLLATILWSHLACYTMSWAHYDAILFVWNRPSRPTSLWLSTRCRRYQLFFLMLYCMNIAGLFFVRFEYWRFLLSLWSVHNWTIHDLVVATNDIFWLWSNCWTLGLTRVRL